MALRAGRNLFCTEFHADFRSGLHFDLGGCTSEHKWIFHVEVPMRRSYFFWGTPNCRCVVINLLLMLCDIFSLEWWIFDVMLYHQKVILEKNWNFSFKRIFFFLRNLRSSCFRSVAENHNKSTEWRIVEALSFHFWFWQVNI